MQHLDTDLLRTFLAVADTGSITGAAAVIGRSQSAASLQIKGLEALLGQPLFDRHARGAQLTPAGERLEDVARRVVRDLDLAFAELSGEGLEGRLRLGIPEEHHKPALSRILAAFAAQHPAVELVAHCAPSATFPQALAAGVLDLALFEVEAVLPGMERLRKERLHWVAARRSALEQRAPLPLALFDRDCWWREAALQGLRRAGRRYRVVFTSESTSGVAAAIEAGVAIGPMAESAIPRGCTALPALDASAPLPRSTLVMQPGAGQERPPLLALAATIRQAFAAGASAEEAASTPRPAQRTEE